MQNLLFCIIPNNFTANILYAPLRDNTKRAAPRVAPLSSPHIIHRHKPIKQSMHYPLRYHLLNLHNPSHIAVLAEMSEIMIKNVAFLIQQFQCIQWHGCNCTAAFPIG